eukprot:31368-Pelagococcus_subviridis.AAC.2
MKIFAELKDRGDTRFKNPRSLAEAIIQAIPAENSFFEKLAVAGPGFINITFSREFLAQEALRVFHCSADGTFETTRKFRKLTAKRAVVDYSSPNIAKESVLMAEMHVGHLRSTIIGETICRALEFVGVEVIRLNHVGDWGTQFGMLLAHLEDISESSDFEVKNLQELYKVSHLLQGSFVSFSDFLEDIHHFYTRNVRGQLWCTYKLVSRQDFEEIYRLLDVHILERGESYYNYLIPDVLSELIEKEIAVQSDGALCIFADGSDSPLICRKSNGSFNYASTDLAALWQTTNHSIELLVKQRISDLCADWIIYVTDVGQKKHFDAIFDAASRAGWLKRENGVDGKRFRTRSGDTVPLKSLLREAQSRCLDSLRGRESTLSDDELEGNTAVYLLYTHARISSLLERAHTQVLKDEFERVLALTIMKFPDVVESVVQVLGGEQERSRTFLCQATAISLRQCFHILGIEPLYRL